MSDRDNFRHAVDAVTHDALDAGLQGLVARWARSTRTNQRDLHDTGRFVDILQDNVATVGLQSRTNHFDRLFDLATD